MKYVKGLSEAERQTLLEAFRHAPWPRFRQRAHAVLLSGKGYKLAQLADIFDVDRDTVSGWLNAWERYGLLGLRDRDHPGRPRKGTEEEREWLFGAVKDAPHQLRALPAQFEERTGQPVSTDTLRRWLKEKGWTWKRCRRSLKEKRDEAEFLEGRRILEAFHEREAAGELDVFYLDESGFSSRSCVPYAWQAKGETLRLPANVAGRMNVIGFLNRHHETYFHTVDGSVTHQEVMGAMDGFIRSRNPEKLTIIVMDNASVHRKAVAEGQWEWLGHRVWVWFLPAYSPELNPIEILWKKIKYEWLPWAAYQCFETMRFALAGIFENLGGKYRVNFA
jgi:transposase